MAYSISGYFFNVSFCEHLESTVHVDDWLIFLSYYPAIVESGKGRTAYFRFFTMRTPSVRLGNWGFVSVILLPSPGPGITDNV